MNFSNKTVIAVGPFDEINNRLAVLKTMDFLKTNEIHFVHVFNTVNYTTFIGEFPVVYPVQADRDAIEKSIVSLLNGIGKKVLPDNFDGKIITRCLFDVSPKAKFSEYVTETNANLVIIPTRLKHNLFDSSFAQYVNKHTHANLIILKNE